MKVSLISPYSDITSLGVRIISSCLKQAGHKVRLIFLPYLDPEVSSKKRIQSYFSDQLVELCQDSGLIGMSLMTSHFERMVALTSKLREKLNSPILWGGIHPTIRPQECLQFADMVCIGEGEEAVVELANRMDSGQDFYDLSGFWLKREGEVICNKPRPLIQDLDKIPFPDYDLDEQYIQNVAKLCRMDELLLQKYMTKGLTLFENESSYQTMATRGCPHNCSYCCNNVLRSMYAGQRYLRRRSVENIIEELAQAKERMAFITNIWLSDDSFFAASLEEIEEFNQAYKERIGLPFFCLVSPRTMSRKKMEALLEAGLTRIQMGIETGSPRTQSVYNRRISNPEVMKAVKIINEFKSRMQPPFYDIIIDNPYESEEDEIQTLSLLLRIPEPYRIQLFSLILFPETDLYRRAKADGLIGNERRLVYRKGYNFRRGTYLNLLFILLSRGFPKSLLRFLGKPKLISFLSRGSFRLPFESIYRLLRAIRLILEERRCKSICGSYWWRERRI